MTTFASVSVWGKGFAVAKRHKEFQRLVPDASTPLTETLAAQLDAAPAWHEVVSRLPEVSERELAQQGLLLLARDELLFLSVGVTEDGFGRPAGMAVAATLQTNWNDPNLPAHINKLQALTARLVREYRDILRGCPESIETQLSQGRFLPNRQFDLGSEEASEGVWGRVIEAVRPWSNIAGVGTPILADLGANVLVGTRHEAERWKKSALAGYFSVRDSAILPLGDRLARWAPQPSDEAEPESAPEPVEDAVALKIEALEKTVQALDANVVKLTKVIERAVGLFTEVMRDRGKKKSKWL